MSKYNIKFINCNSKRICAIFIWLNKFCLSSSFTPNKNSSIVFKFGLPEYGIVSIILIEPLSFGSLLIFLNSSIGDFNL